MSSKIKWILLIAIVILGITAVPTLWMFLATEPTAAMGIIFLSILCFNPIFSLIIGAIAGSDIKAFWYAPFITVIVFLPYSCWLLREFVPEMLIYSSFYLAAAFAAMGFSHTLFKRMKTKNEERAIMARKCKRNKNSYEE